MPERIFGAIPDVPPGTLFEHRRALHDRGVHGPLMAGISGTGAEGADSIVVSGGYEDDQDLGDVIIYTGHGGNDPSSGKQVADQLLERGNLALARSSLEGLPVRVVRGAAGDPAESPETGYRYDGLYSVVRYWQEVGRSGFLIWRFRLERLGEPTDSVAPPAKEGQATPRAVTTVQRIIRSTKLAVQVKAMHDHVCQVCGIQVETPAGPYAEGAHLRPLGRPHDGPDSLGNLLCLCPNDHVRLDYGAIAITDDLVVVSVPTGERISALRTHPQHPLDPLQIRYHRELFAS